jgi:hypothetical protein
MHAMLMASFFRRFPPLKILRMLPLVFPLALIGCGGGSSSTKLTPDFTLASTPSTVSVVNGGPAQAVTVTASGVNSFTGSVSVSLTGLPTGVTASPATLSINPGQLGQFMLAASGAAVNSSIPLTLTGTSGSLSHTANATLNVTAAAPPTTITLSNLSYDFGGDLVGTALSNTVVTVSNPGSDDVSLSPSLSGDPSFALVSSGSCGATIAAGTSCSEIVSYTPTTPSGATPQTATLNLNLANSDPATPQTVTLTGTSATLTPGKVAKTSNPQVALYSITLPFPGSVTVNFGTDTSYGRSTWSQSTNVAGGTINMLVAGMLHNTLYHMQAVIHLANGATATDADQTFQSGTPEVSPSGLTTTTTAGMTPQSGLEELTVLAGNRSGIVITDLQGNVLWSYTLTGAAAVEEIDGVKMLPNGHFLITVADGSEFSGTPPANNIVAIREIDLAGNIVREISMADLNLEMAAAGYNITLQQFHHDVTPLPNGHWLVLANTIKQVSNVTGFPGVNNVLGDVIVDLDENLQPVWVWNEFDHLDVNRHPMNFPDWTHTNSVIYSPSDGNIIVSIRHQNWVVKVAYNDGAGNGDILWRLGYQGDFTLAGGTDPIDWQYAQHFASLFSPNSAGVFSLGMMDNGDDRNFGTETCGGSGPSCTYTTIPVFQIDETAKTATLTFHQILPASMYSNFGGNTDLLANGNVEYDLCGEPTGSDIYEVTQTSDPQTVWHMQITGTHAYRGFRIPSLYPDVQW